MYKYARISGSGSAKRETSAGTNLHSCTAGLDRAAYKVYTPGRTGRSLGIYELVGDTSHDRAARIFVTERGAYLVAIRSTCVKYCKSDVVDQFRRACGTPQHWYQQTSDTAPAPIWAPDALTHVGTFPLDRPYSTFTSTWNLRPRIELPLCHCTSSSLMSLVGRTVRPRGMLCLPSTEIYFWNCTSLLL